MNAQWISYDPEIGLEYHNTEAEAVEFAKSIIADYNDGEWSDGVENILVARITHTVEETNVVTKDMLDAEDCYKGSYYGNQYERWSDRKMTPVVPAITGGSHE